MSVFVQLTSYKNFDTVPTVLDCLEKASDKAGVKFGVVLQQDEDVPAELNRPGVSVQKVPVSESKGPGWARRLAQSMYSSEDHTLQVSSGSRFAEGWDRILVEALQKTGSAKPIVTNSPNKFNPANGELEVPGVAYRLQPQAFLNAAPSCWSAPMKGLNSTVPARIANDNFIFTLGSHCLDCKYDPSIYYSELDSVLTVRSYTLGYDLFNHHLPVVWMDYGKRPRHWEDHADWWLRSHHSAERLTELVGGGLSSFGLGTARTMEDYQRYSGLDFVGRRIHKDVLAGKAPPLEYKDEKSWSAAMGSDYSITVSWNPDEIERSDDYDYWYFAVEDAAGNNIVRQDLRHERDAPIMQFKVSHRKVFMKSFDGRVPANLCIWPLSKSKGWLKKSKFPITSSVG